LAIPGAAFKDRDIGDVMKGRANMNFFLKPDQAADSQAPAHQGRTPGAATNALLETVQSYGATRMVAHSHLPAGASKKAAKDLTDAINHFEAVHAQALNKINDVPARLGAELNEEDYRIKSFEQFAERADCKDEMALLDAWSKVSRIHHTTWSLVNRQ
jgi:hypothetical protein